MFPARTCLQCAPLQVYASSLLVSKKRYVGHSLEDSTQAEPRLDAKGIELVRRDQCPFVVRMQVRNYCIIASVTVHSAMWDDR